jgi:hypothetical protein
VRKHLRLIVVATGLVAAVAFPATAVAVSPHFITADAARDGNNLEVTWKEAGLGDNQRIDYTASATATRVDSCVNRGGQIPNDPKKTTTVAEVSAEGTFSVKNGSVEGSLTVEPPATTLDCPGGQVETLQSLTYTDVSITDDTNGITEDIPGTF